MGGARRTHNKTRLGCGGCKKRRVKCDGKHPTCANCEKRGQECTFLLLAPSTSLTSAAVSIPSYKVTASPSSNKSSPDRQYHTPTDHNIITEPPRHLTFPDGDQRPGVWDEVRPTLDPFQQILLDHYTKSTSRTLATDESAQSAWATSIPEMASEHKYLVHGVLSVSALHLAHLARLYDGEKPDRQDLYRIAAEQMNRGLVPFRNELRNINEGNAAPLFAHSTLTAVYFFRTSALDMEEARASIPDGAGDPPAKVIDDMIDSFMRTFWGLRGALTVLKPGWNWVIGGELASICTRKWWPKHRVPQNERAKEEDKKLGDLEKLWLDDKEGKHAECLSKALSDLRETYALVSLLTDPENEYPQIRAPIPYSVDDTTVGMLRDRAAIFVWATQLSREFVTLGEQKNCEVLVLVAHFAVLLGRVRNVWWLEGLGLNTVWAIAMALGREKWHLIEWPVQTLGLDLEDMRDVKSTRDDSLGRDLHMSGT